MVRSILICIFLLWVLGLDAQTGKAGMADSTETILLKSEKSNTPELRKALQSRWQQKGYLLAKVDSTGPTLLALHKGILFDSFTVTWPLSYNRPKYKSTVTELLMEKENWLTEMENTGYPFAGIGLSIANQDSQLLEVALEPMQGEKYNFDTFVFPGFQFSSRFMAWSARIKKGETYEHDKVQTLLSRVSSLDGFAALQEPNLYVVDGKMHIGMPVQKSVKDQLSGLVGLATSPEGRPVFTGEVTARFYNMFQAGVYTGLEWRSFRARSQELKINGSLPYLFGTPFITRYQMALEKFDTLYSSFTRGLQLRFPLGKNAGLLAGAVFTDRFRIYLDKDAVLLFRQLPQNPPTRNNLYQLGLEKSNLIPGKMPMRGFQMSLQAGIGTRSFVRDPEIAAITWFNNQGVQENIYDSLNRIGQLRSTQYKVTLHVAGYIPLASWLVLKLAGEGVKYHAPTIYFNELERFGGIKNIRGFNEQSIFASEFYLSTLELRLVSENNGYVAPFYHLGWYRDASGTSQSGSGYIQGTGIQFAFQTSAGVLQIAWAIGKTGQASYGLNQSKFHFGISSVF